MSDLMIRQPVLARMSMAIVGSVILLIILHLAFEFQLTETGVSHIPGTQGDSRVEPRSDLVTQIHRPDSVENGTIDKQEFDEGIHADPEPGSYVKKSVPVREPSSTIAIATAGKDQQLAQARWTASIPNPWANIHQTRSQNNGIAGTALPSNIVLHDIYGLHSSVRGDSIPKSEDPSQYYGENMLQKYSLSNLAFKSPIPRLTPRTEEIFRTNASRIASWDPHRPKHRGPGAYVVSSFLKDENRQYRAVIYLYNLLTQSSVRRPQLNISINYESATHVDLECSYIPPVETSKLKYTGSRDIQVHVCPVPVEIGGLLRFKKIDNLKASLSAMDHNYTVHVVLREWDTEQGHTRPTQQYEFTSVTFVKPQHRRCAGDRCDPPVVERLAEWVAHHLLIGFDHMYIYTAEGWDLVQQRLAPFIQMGKVTVFAANELDDPPAGGHHVGQILCFSSHVERYHNYSKYIFIQDVDEMLYISPQLLPPGPEGGFPEHLDSLLSKLIFKKKHDAEREGGLFCAISFAWFTLSPDSPNVTGKSVIKSYHLSLRHAPSNSFDDGRYKTLTKSSYSSPYSCQHFVSFNPNFACHRILASVRESFLIHYRASDRNSHIQPVDYRFRSHFTDALFVGVSKLMVDLKLW